MKNKKIISLILLVITTIIWGSAFIFQDIGMQYVEPITFNVFRCLTCTIFLVLLSLIIFLINKIKKKESTQNYKWKDLLIGGTIAGLLTGAAMACQQIGISIEGAGKSGFITSLYIIFVPLIGLIFGKKVHPVILIALVFSITGLYLININSGEFKINAGTFWLLGCAIFYALQIIAIGKYTNKCDSIKLTATQFLISGLIQLPFMFIFETPNIANVINCIIPILYCGILSGGIAFTFQVYTQKYIDATIASMIMGLESVFAIICDIIFLKSKYSLIEILGCILIFFSVIITQLPYDRIFKRKKNQT